ncbi:DUF1697 domain-containing protein [Termitidicoccus mucosus]|uniref:DUF1697 domain-containing protein n=1 Tax=Termitidicoccus mucosus TaxID=1184151 RepID=A0A178IFI5_9BACT|nr:hypothetical protein AW736_17250 [Opitutaceae bacterium TSB47]
MARHVAFLRGVSPMNAKMPELKRCFESAGFVDVKTVLSSGNVVFDSSLRSLSGIERKAEAAMARHLGRAFPTIARTVGELQRMIEADPFARFDLPAEAKRVVTFLRKPCGAIPRLPIEKEGARILALEGREVFTAYVPNPRGPVFMNLIEKAFGAGVTTRTWETVRKCAQA